MKSGVASPQRGDSLGCLQRQQVRDQRGGLHPVGCGGLSDAPSPPPSALSGNQRFTFVQTRCSTTTSCKAPGPEPTPIRRAYRVKFEAGHGAGGGGCSFASGDTCSSSLTLSSSSPSSVVALHGEQSGGRWRDFAADRRHHQRRDHPRHQRGAKRLRTSIFDAESDLRLDVPLRLEQLLQPALHGLDANLLRAVRLCRLDSVAAGATSLSLPSAWNRLRVSVAGVHRWGAARDLALGPRRSAGVGRVRSVSRTLAVGSQTFGAAASMWLTRPGRIAPGLQCVSESARRSAAGGDRGAVLSSKPAAI